MLYYQNKRKSKDLIELPIQCHDSVTMSELKCLFSFFLRIISIGEENILKSWVIKIKEESNFMYSSFFFYDYFI